MAALAPGRQATVAAWPAPIVRGRLTLGTLYVYLMWFMVLMDPHRWLAFKGFAFMNQALPIMAVPMIAMIVLRAPAVMSARRVIWFAPLLGFLASVAVTIPFAMFPERAWGAFKIFLVYYLLAVATFIYINSIRRLIPLIVLFVGQWWWWGWHAGATGAIWWHPALENFDASGPLMLFGIPLTFFFAQGSRERMYRWGGYFLAAYCTLGVVTSFARGVFLSLVILGILLWLRSPRKGHATLAMVVGVATVLLATRIIYPDGGFWTEMKSAFTEGKDEGTGEDRWELWTAATAVFKHHPVFGVGAEHVGIVASVMLRNKELELPGYYGQHPAQMWGRQLHNVYMQILSEHGLVGVAMFLWLVVDFWRRNARLRRRDYQQHWAVLTRGRFALHSMAIGLEGAMVAYLATAFFYTQLYMPWMFSIVTVNAVIQQVAAPPRGFSRPRPAMVPPA